MDNNELKQFIESMNENLSNNEKAYVIMPEVYYKNGIESGFKMYEIDKDIAQSILYFSSKKINNDTN